MVSRSVFVILGAEAAAGFGNRGVLFARLGSGFSANLIGGKTSDNFSEVILSVPETAHRFRLPVGHRGDADRSAAKSAHRYDHLNPLVTMPRPGAAGVDNGGVEGAAGEGVVFGGDGEASGAGVFDQSGGFGKGCGVFHG